VEAVTVAQRHVGPLGAPTTVELAVTVRLAHPVDTDGVVSVSCGRARVRVPVAVRGGRGQVTAALTVTSPKLWWPNGYGAQPLYPLEAGWEGGDAPVRLRLGLRTLELRTEPDRTPDGKDAESMTFVVNGRAIFAKGANWIPPDQLVERCTPDVYRHLLQSMAAAHMNMVRVWGGGWYELDEFYAACDELGLLVWQDFMMACMLSPDTPEFIAELVAEAREQVHRLQHHACVALWCGDNEVLGFINAWWKNTDLREAVDEPYRRVMTALRDAVTEADATRRFWVSSPSNGWIDPHSESPHKGDVHYWRVWHGQQPFSDYRTVRPRFCSEFGFQSFPEPRTLRACVPAAGLNPSSWHMEHHQRSHNGNQYIMNALARELPIPHGLDGYCWASQINHANAIRTAVEHWRRTKPWCAGILYWQLNDLWPVASWSSIDYHGRWKALHHAATRFYAPLLATGVHDPAAGTVTVWATSDVPRPLALRGRLTAMTWAGEVVGAVPLRAHLPPDASAPVATVELTDLLRGQAAPREVCLFVELAAGRWRARNHLTLVPWKHVALPRPKLRAGLVRAGDGLALNLRTDTVAAFVHAEIAGTESHFAGSFDVLRPDETYVWPLVEHRQRGQAPLTLTAARRNLRVFSLYDLIWRDA
jgi:beta-mannosidase